MISHGGTIRTFIHEATVLAPPPLANGALFVARWADERFVSVARVEGARTACFRSSG